MDMDEVLRLNAVISEPEVFEGPSGIVYRLGHIGAIRTMQLIAEFDMNVNDILYSKNKQNMKDMMVFVKRLFELWIVEPRLDDTTSWNFGVMNDQDKDALLSHFKTKRLTKSDVDRADKFRRDPDGRGGGTAGGGDANATDGDHAAGPGGVVSEQPAVVSGDPVVV